jgi:hypothetical protein
MYMLFLLFSLIAGFIPVQPSFYLNLQVVTAFLISSHIHFLVFIVFRSCSCIYIHRGLYAVDELEKSGRVLILSMLFSLIYVNIG